MLSLEPREPLVRVVVVLLELLDHVLTDITVVLLDPLGDPQLVLGRDIGRLAPVSEELLDERRDVFAGDRDVLDRRADHVALGNGDRVGDSVSRVNDDSGERSVRRVVRPGGGEGEDGLDSDVETLR